MKYLMKSIMQLPKTTTSYIFSSINLISRLLSFEVNIACVFVDKTTVDWNNLRTIILCWIMRLTNVTESNYYQAG